MGPCPLRTFWQQHGRMACRHQHVGTDAPGVPTPGPCLSPTLDVPWRHCGAAGSRAQGLREPRRLWARPIDRIGSSEILDESGSGGFGRVYRARRVDLDVIRAVSQ